MAITTFYHNGTTTKVWLGEDADIVKAQKELLAIGYTLVEVNAKNWGTIERVVDTDLELIRTSENINGRQEGQPPTTK